MLSKFTHILIISILKLIVVISVILQRRKLSFRLICSRPGRQSPYHNYHKTAFFRANHRPIFRNCIFQKWLSVAQLRACAETMCLWWKAVGKRREALNLTGIAEIRYSLRPVFKVKSKDIKFCKTGHGNLTRLVIWFWVNMGPKSGEKGVTNQSKLGGLSSHEFHSSRFQTKKKVTYSRDFILSRKITEIKGNNSNHKLDIFPVVSPHRS